VKGQDLLVALKLATKAASHWTYQGLAAELGISRGEAHNAVRRLLLSGLLREGLQGIGPNPRNLEKFLLGGAEFVFPAERTAPTRGMATSVSAAPLAEHFAQLEGTSIVWPDEVGDTRGVGLVPIYPSVPFAARQDPKLYELLALFDAIRDSQLRGRKEAEAQIKKVLHLLLWNHQYGKSHGLEAP
jgi:hypothetical protein